MGTNDATGVTSTSKGKSIAKPQANKEPVRNDESDVRDLVEPPVDETANA
jgi:hypothetical protein